MLSTLSNSAFSMRYNKLAPAGPPPPATFTQFTYTLGGEQPNQHNLLDSPDPYAIQVNSGYCTVTIDGMSSASFANVDKTIYIKSKFGTATNDTGSLFMFVHSGSALNTGNTISMWKDSSNGSQIKYSIGSDSTTHRYDTITGQSGSDYFHIFLNIRSDDVLETYIYDESVTQKYYSSTTIVSSTLGQGLSRFQYNGRPTYPDLNARKIVVGNGGTWDRVLTVAEMEAEVTADPS
jgi:hypothetical protein